MGIRKYSNTKIKDAGKILVSPNSFTKAEVDSARDKLTYWRTIHGEPINTFQATLRKKTQKLGFKDALIAQRLKRAVSIVSKLQRFHSMKLSTMQDIAGLRAIVNNVSQVRAIEDNYRQSKFQHILIDSKDYILNPSKSGYRGIHLIYQYYNPRKPESHELKIELQIRSKLQHTWATAVETMGTFLNASLKSSQGPTNWLEYFSLVSAGFAILENCTMPPQYIGKSDEDIFQMINDESKRLNVEEKLRGFTVAADHIFDKYKNSKYNLITLNLEKRVVNVKKYSAKELQRANDDYSKIEANISDGAPLQCVLVSTNRIDSLAKAYPSYFLDTQEFLKKLNLITAKLKRMKSVQ